MNRDKISKRDLNLQETLQRYKLGIVIKRRILRGVSDEQRSKIKI